MRNCRAAKSGSQRSVSAAAQQQLVLRLGLRLQCFMKLQLLS